MRIAVVGGLDRHVASLAKQAERAGHVAEFHHGRVGGRSAEDLEAIVERSDVVVIVTGVNSHGAVSIAKRAARRSGCPAVIARSCGPSRFEQVLSALSRGRSFRGVSQLTV
jgi:predicted dehydrogenase